MSDENIKFRDTVAVSIFQSLLESTVFISGSSKTLIACSKDYLNSDKSYETRKKNDTISELKKIADLSYQLADYLREARLKVFE